MNKLYTEIFGLTLKNPITVGSGTYGFGENYKEFYSPTKLGAITVKGMTMLPREGNSGTRGAETPSGMLNCVGLQNPGIDVFIKDYLPQLKNEGNIVFANIAGKDIEEFVEMAIKLENSQVDLIELNLSCPNVKEGGIAFGTSGEMVGLITRKVKEVTGKPVVVKLTPNVTDIVSIAGAAEQNGADGLTLINTLLGMAIDVDTGNPILGNVFGGLSGPAIKPVALRMVYQVYKHVKIPIIGMGGIVNERDALEFFMAGASMIGVGTGNFIDPMCPLKIKEGLQRYLDIKGIGKITEIVGLAHRGGLTDGK